ncbi:hypothetical protein GCM10012284_51070 [Mangrovihabitans endophyticus]|uniref:Uncharacterized protein n=1 Tax=Mangrovihabitans endophyticus TaxID=1751298 RepID=A0A8J3C4Z7_9ACTN|nr:hypothetical protein GCM10012284_51070 [Mangrovihabitans endophyticus]
MGNRRVPPAVAHGLAARGGRGADLPRCPGPRRTTGVTHKEQEIHNSGVLRQHRSKTGARKVNVARLTEMDDIVRGPGSGIEH